MSRNNTSNQNSVLDNVFSGFPNLFASQERNASNQNQRINQQAPKPTNYYPPHTPIAQTNLRNQSQNHNPCFHRESTLGSIFSGNLFFPPKIVKLSQNELITNLWNPNLYLENQLYRFKV